MSEKKRILVLDDEEAIHYIFDRMLGEDYELIHATSIQESLAKCFQVKELDLVITDVFLGGETGIELVGEIREFRKNIPIIIMSAYADEMTEKVIANIKEMFHCEFVDKPFENKTIENLVKHLLR